MIVVGNPKDRAGDTGTGEPKHEISYPRSGYPSCDAGQTPDAGTVTSEVAPMALREPEKAVKARTVCDMQAAFEFRDWE